ncbi:MAG: hypothetical protein ACLPVI_00725 [Dehalococcoidales bacterium]
MPLVYRVVSEASSPEQLPLTGGKRKRWGVVVVSALKNNNKLCLPAWKNSK